MPTSIPGVLSCIDGLNDILRVRPIVWFYDGRLSGIGGSEDSGRKCESVKVSAFSCEMVTSVHSLPLVAEVRFGPAHCTEDRRPERILTCSSVVEYNQETGVVNPLDLETSVDIVPIGEGSLDISRFELLREARQREDACNTRRELRERSCHVMSLSLGLGRDAECGDGNGWASTGEEGICSWLGKYKY